MFLFTIVNNTKPSTENGHEELSVESSGEEAPLEIIVINEIGKHFTVPVAALPQLATYLEAESDVEMELARIQYEFLTEDADNFVLKYGCGNKQCQLLLVQMAESGDITTAEIGEGIYAGADVFQQKALIRIAENEGNEVVRHKIVLIDLLTMTPLLPIEEQLIEHYFTQAIFPITKFEWLDDDTIRLEVAELQDTTFDSIKEWYEADYSSVKTVNIKLRGNAF